MPDEHQECSEIALSSCHGSAGSSPASGKARAIQIWIAVLSVIVSPSTARSGTLCLGLIAMKSADMCCWRPRLSGLTSNSAPASVRVIQGASAQVVGA